MGLVLSGAAAVKMADGTERVMREGEFFYVPPGHDSWVVGDEPYVSLHILGSETYAELMRLHDYPASANCFKVRLLLAQLGLDYERVEVDIFGGDTLTDEFASLNPARMTPVLETEAGPLPESNAILVHLAEGSELLPADPAERAQVMRWLFYEQAEIQPGIAGLRFRLLTGALDPDDGRLAQRQATGAAALAVLEGHLREHPFLAGERYSIADISDLRVRARGRRRALRPGRLPGRGRLGRPGGGDARAS